MFLFDGIALRKPWHSKEAVTPTGTSRPMLAAIARAAPSRLPRADAGEQAPRIADFPRRMGEAVRQLFAPPPIRRGSRWGAMLEMAANKHRDAPEGVQKQGHDVSSSMTSL
jgi:hypothetical protein